MDAAAVWEPYDEIVDGLEADYKPRATNYLNHPVVFQKDGIWYVINGNMPKWTGGGWDRYIRFYGHRWNGSAWVEDDGIVSGLPRRITHLAPSVFCGNGEWYLISGNSTGRFMGYKWVRSWQPDDTLTTGLDDVGNRSTPVVFSIDGTWYLISGKDTGGFSGYRYVPTVTQAHETFDTGRGTYPSIAGTHYGTIIPGMDLTVNRIYTYPCAGTGGHTEYIKIWNDTTGDCAVAQWNGYGSVDYHNLTFNTTITLRKGVVYHYIVRTGSYPQIIHAPYKQLPEGNITCTQFIDVNNRTYNDWIPAIRLYRREDDSWVGFHTNAGFAL